MGSNSELRTPNFEKAWLLAPLIFILTFAVFLPTLSAGFVNWDDDKNFLENPNYRGLGWTQIHWMWTTSHMATWVPVSWMTLGLDYLVWAMEPFGYHLTNVLWHCANAVLLYLIGLVLFGKSPAAVLGALFSALVFAMHPLRVESVAWITERRDVVSGFLYLAAILFYMKSQTGSRRNYWASLACFAVAVAAKVMTVTLPAVLLVLDVYPLRRLGGGRGKWFGAEARKVWIEKLPFFAISMVGSVLAFRAFHNGGLITDLGWFQRIVMSVYGLAFYLWKTLVPTDLVPFYAITPHRLDPLAWPAQISFAVVILIAAAAILLRRKWPAFTVAVVVYGITLLPVVGIFDNGQQITADRYSYLPCLGWAILAGGCAMVILRACEHRAIGKGAVAVLAAVVVVTLGFQTWRQSGRWHDSRTLWTYAAAVEPSFIAWNNLGMDLAKSGDSPGAVVAYRKSIEFDAGHPDSHNNLGASLLMLGNWDDAVREFQIALKLKPDLANAQAGWGYVLMKQGKRDEAIAHFEAALKLAPDYQAARDYLEHAKNR